MFLKTPKREYQSTRLTPMHPIQSPLLRMRFRRGSSIRVRRLPKEGLQRIAQIREVICEFQAINREPTSEERKEENQTYQEAATKNSC